MESLFPVSVHCLPKLKHLDVQDASKLEKIFEIANEANVSKDKEESVRVGKKNKKRILVVAIYDICGQFGHVFNPFLFVLFYKNNSIKYNIPTWYSFKIHIKI